MLPLLVSVVPLLGAAALLARAWRPPEVRLRVRGGALEVELGTWDTVYALRRGLRVPATAVTAVRDLHRDDVARHGMRLPGTSLPGVIRAGSYGVGAARELWDVRRAARWLVVDLAPGQAYRRLVLQVPRPEHEAARLRAALGL